MVRKRKKNNKSIVQNKKPSPTELDFNPQDLEMHILDLLEAAKFREAVDASKKLLQLESSSERLALLARAYVGRAQGLTDKGMYKEAMAIWRNRSERCGIPLQDAYFFYLLLKTGQIKPAFELYKNAQAELQNEGSLADVREQLAALSLAQPDTLKAAALPTDDVIVRNYPAAKAALAAYCAGDDEALQTHLQAIAFRSPFRDLRSILKSLLLSEDDAFGATQLLKKISARSAFWPLAEAVKLSLNNDKTQVLLTLSSHNREMRRFVAARKSISSEQPKLAEELRQLGSSPSPESLLRFVIRNEALLGSAFARAAALRLLLLDPSSRHLLNRSFAKLTEFELDLIKAWHQELENAHPRHIMDAWLQAVESLAECDCVNGKEYKLTIALMIHHILKHHDRLDPPPLSAVHWLDQILKYDPQDHAAYVRVIATLRSAGELKKARAHLDKAMLAFPNDIAILTEAVETAIAGSAFKKAALLAKRILEKDPINVRVRTVLIDAHLAHARKLISQRKSGLVEKELAIADTWARSELDQGRIALLRGKSLSTQGEKTEATAIWESAEAILGGGLCARFYFIVELNYWQASIAEAIKNSGLQPLSNKISNAELLKLFHLLQSSFKDKRNQVRDVLKELTPVLKNAVRAINSRAEFELCCELLAHFSCDRLRLHYAHKANKHSPNIALFEYHELSAKTELNKKLNKMDETRLGTLFDLLMEDQSNAVLKHRVVQLIERHPRLAEKYLYDNGDDDDDFPFPYDDSDEEDDDDDDDGEDFFGDIDKLIDELIKTIPPHQLKEMRQELGTKGLREFLKKMITMSEMDQEEDELDFFAPTPSKKKKKKTPKIQLDLF